MPRTNHAGYLDLLAGSRIVVGQAAGILAASELEALAIGAPLVVPASLPLYNSPPVHALEAGDAAEAVAAVLDGELPHDPDMVRDWTRENHGVVGAVDVVDGVYRQVLAVRG